MSIISNRTGGFAAYWKRVYKVCEQCSSPNTFGGKTLNHASDLLFRTKRARCHADPSHPFKVFDADGRIIDYKLFIMVVIEEVKVCFCLLATEKLRILCRSDFIWGLEEDGPLAGIKYVTLKNVHTNTKKMNSHQDSTNLHHQRIYQTNDVFGCYSMLHTLCFVLLPPDRYLQNGTDIVFRYEASKKQKKTWIEDHGRETAWRCSPLENQEIGANQYNPMAIKLATVCGYDNPITNRGTRHPSSSRITNDTGIIGQPEEQLRQSTAVEDEAGVSSAAWV